MTHEQRVANIERLGYTPSEAAFLALAALHGGYFIRRQFCDFLGVVSGKRATALVARISELHHANRYAFGQNRSVIHIRHKALYAAIGEPESRNRREHQPFSLQSRLMALDYVLAHSGSTFLVTARERSEALLRLGATAESVAVSASARGFSGHFPVRMEGTSVTFTFIDAGYDTESAFVTFLRAHRHLFESLPAFHLDFVGTIDSRFGRAAAVFDQVLSKGRLPGLDAEMVDRLVQHFEDRTAFEARQTQQFDRARLDRLRDDLSQFSSPAHQALFALWKAQGGEAVKREVAAKRGTQGIFRKVQLPVRYSLCYTQETA
jgi:hypothetical protein